MFSSYSVEAGVAIDFPSGMIYSERTDREPEGAGINIRIAVYPENGHPEVLEAAASSPGSATNKFSKLVMERVEEKIPEEAVREVVENLIHAGYRGVVISVLNNGSVVRVSDKGPGIESKSRAMEFGFSGATLESLLRIRGVGAGLGIAKAAAERVGGTVTIEDNIGGGTVATISVPAEGSTRGKEIPVEESPPRRRYPDAVPKMNISERQQKVLITVLECGEVGPSTVADQLEISVSTAYRDLSVLEEHGLVTAAESGKREISPLGRDLVEAIVDSWVK